MSRRPVRRLTRAAALAAAAALFAAPAGAQVAGPQTWIDHVTEDLAPFFLHPDAVGSGDGAFLSGRCNDGAAWDAADPCAELPIWQAANRHVVSQSRLTFSYAVAFHMTGEEQYLDLARAGAANVFADFQDPASGLFHQNLRLSDGALSPGIAAADVQQQGYALLGPAMVYYLTGDAALYDRIRTAADAIDARYGVAGGGYSRFPDQGVLSGRLVTSLDPLNTYLQLMSTAAPGADAGVFAARGRALADRIFEAHWLEERGLFDTDLDDASTLLDFGHSAKSLWFGAMAAARSGDAGMAAWARAQAGQLFDQAFSAAMGSWASRSDGTDVNTDANWWMSAELGQLMASLAMTDESLRARLAETQAFWLEHFVDSADGGVWSLLDGETGDPVGTQTKQWQWKAGFHTYEHALVSYLTAADMAEEDAVLWFAREEEARFDMAYLFEAEANEIQEIDLGGVTAQRVSFGGLTFAATAVPLPAGAALLPLGLAALAAARRRRRG